MRQRRAQVQHLHQQPVAAQPPDDVSVKSHTMKTTIIAWSNEHLELLSQTAISDGYDVIQTIERDEKSQLSQL